MLDRLRSRFPHVRSMLMDRATLLAHETQWVREERPINTRLDRLTPDEADLYRDLVEDTIGPSLRLEQERVRYSWILKNLITGSG
ncbi:MAG: Wadjet anti-phage system protein JetD domain-containing protein, partial [Pseudonocardiaceae bacterium]